MSPFLNRAFSFVCIYLCCSLSVKCQYGGSYKLNPQQLDSLIFMNQLPQNQLLYEPGYFSGKANKVNKLQIDKAPIPKLNSIQRSTTTCYDSSGRFFLRKDSVHFYVNGVSKTPNGMLLIAGTYSDYTSGFARNTAYILKTDESGNVIWGKTYDSLNHVSYSTINYYKTLELQNGNLILVGKTNNLATGNEDLLLTKTDNTGNIIWSKTYKSIVWTNGNGSADYYYVQQIKEDPVSGDVYLTGPHWALGRNINKVDQNNGNLLWSKMYNPSNGNYSENVFGIDILQNEIISFGKISSGTFTWVGIYRINKTNGDTIATKYYSISDAQAYNLSFLGTDPMVKLNNGHYRISGSCYGFFGVPAPYYQGAVCEFDENLNFVKAFCVRNNVPGSLHAIKFSLFPDNTGLFSMALYVGANVMDHHYLQLNDMTILKERKKQYANGLVSFENYAVKHSSGADMLIRLLGNNGPGSKIEFLKLQTSDTSSTCVGVNEPISLLQPFNYIPNINLSVASILAGDFVESSNKTITAQSTSANYVPGCQSTSFCDTMKLTASSDTICGSAPLLLNTHKNPECGSNVIFNYDPTYVQSFTQINDSTHQVVFNGAWQGYIYAGIQSCATLIDSVYVTVFSSPPNVNLGTDTSICPGNTIVLDARSGYASYLWSTGGTNSTIAVTTPGAYYVDVVDGCGNASSDTVIVSAAPPIAFNIGADRIKCNADTVHIIAPGGFLNYSWGPAYNINSQTAQSVIVKPMVDTIYFVRAEKTPGCFAFDSILIQVNFSAPINLGADKNFCSGDSAILDAGPGFSQYAWNTGANTQRVSAFTTGNYIVIGTAPNGCSSSDTLRVTNVYALPAINLNKNPDICLGDVKTLDAGAGFSNYLWNTAATGQTINVSAIGKYWVVVTDVNNCIGSDTSEIRNIIPLPVNFLPADTSICNYSTLQVVSTGNYNQYTWSNGANTSIISIRGPGLYWLQVRDAKNCIGRDSILVQPKACSIGFYIPGAFTPNHDSKNEIFKPQIFGNVSNYNFIIFNRYGVVVFKSNDLTTGWDGTFKGRDADNGAYTWLCSFKLNSFQNSEKGTVLLIR